MEAIILAGGFGTRLSHIVNDVPKPMAPVDGQPFLKYIMDDLIIKGITRVIMAVGHKKESIMKYFGNNYNGCEIAYSVEDEPLLTGGAIKKALTICQDDYVFIINGDTFFDVNLKNMADDHKKNRAHITIATKEMKEIERYGSVLIENGRITKFIEKGIQHYGYINGGIYYLQKDIILLINEIKFSFETDILEAKTIELRVFSYISEGYFIDIGIPKDYERAQKEMRNNE